METPGRIAATPDALDFTVENVEKVSFGTTQSLEPGFNGLIDKWSCFKGNGQLEGGSKGTLPAMQPHNNISFYTIDFVWRDNVAVFACRK